MVLAWITKLEITFQLPGDSLIKDPLAGPTQWTSISRLSANFQHQGSWQVHGFMWKSISCLCLT